MVVLCLSFGGVDVPRPTEGCRPCSYQRFRTGPRHLRALGAGGREVLGLNSERPPSIFSPQEIGKVQDEGGAEVWSQTMCRPRCGSSDLALQGSTLMKGEEIGAG